MNRRTGQWLAGICAVGLALRLLVVWPLDESLLGNPDSVEYVAIAHSLATGHGYALGKDYFDGGSPFENPVATAWRLPGYPLLLAGIQLAAGDKAIGVAKAANATIGALSCLLVFIAGRAAFGTSAGLYSAAGLAVYPPLVYFSRDVATETLFVGLLMGVMALAFAHGGAVTPWRSTCIGALGGAAGLVRGEGVLLCGAWLLHCCLARQPARRRLASGLVLVLGFAAVVAPWVVRNSSLPHGRPALGTMAYQMLWLTIHRRVGAVQTGHWNINTYAREGDEVQLADLSEWEREDYFRHVWIEYVRDNPGQYARMVADNVRSLLKLMPTPGYYSPPVRLAAALCSLLLYALATAGAVTGRDEAGRVRLALVYVALVVLMHMPLYSVTRYRVSQIDPVLILLAGQGAAWCAARVRTRRRAGMAGDDHAQRRSDVRDEAQSV